MKTNKEKQAFYAHPTKKRSGSVKYTPIAKHNKTARRMMIALIIKAQADRIAEQAKEELDGHSELREETA